MRKLLPFAGFLLLSSTLGAQALPKQGVGPSFPSHPPTTLNVTVLLNVPLIAQKNCCWCWAASGEMVMTYTGHPIPQCQQATFQFGQAQSQDCCLSPTPGVCVSGGQVEIGHYGYTYTQLGGNSALTPAQIENEIATRKMPWILNPNGPGFGHVIVGVGYSLVAGKLAYIAINDPWPPNKGDFYWESYKNYTCGFWSGVCHTEGYDFYAITPPPLRLPKVPILYRKVLDISEVVPGPDPVSAARAALPDFAALIDANPNKRLGFPSGDALKNATLASPVDEYTVSIARLKDWGAGAKASDLLVKSPGVMIPVEVGGRVAATFRMVSEDGKWSVGAFGGAALGQAWEHARKSEGQFLVEVNGLELAFAGKRDGDKLLLTPLFDEPNLKIVAGREEPAEEIFARLKPLAAAHKPNILAPKGR